MSCVPMKKNPEKIFHENGGQLRMHEAIKRGISRYTLYKLRDKGIIEQISRGVYRLKDLPPIGNPDLVTVSLRFPNAVICLISSLAFHEITTQIPHSVSVAIPRGSRLPSLDYPPVQPHQFSKKAYTTGIETFQIDGVPVKIYNVEKTLADCFKFRNKIGMDIVLEAFKFYRERKKTNLTKLIKYGKICRVDRVMMPYLEMHA